MTPELIQGITLITTISLACAALCPVFVWVLAAPSYNKASVQRYSNARVC